MRADGEITKEIFQTKTSEIKSRLKTIDDDIAKLEPEVDKKQNDLSHVEKISLLKYHLCQLLNPNENDEISDGILRAFVSKIVVHEDTLDWHLRFRPDDSPASDQPQKIAEFTITSE